MSIKQKIKRKFKTEFPVVYARFQNIKMAAINPDGKDEVFSKIHDSNYWSDPHSISGNGSNLKNAEHVIKGLPEIFRKFHVQSVIDAACGDMLWMSKVDFGYIDSFLGIDIVPALIERNVSSLGNHKFKFMTANLAETVPPKADLIICRDMLVHNSYENLRKIIANFKASGSKYLLATNFHNFDKNIDIITGNWRPLNLCDKPFNFPAPIYSLDEKSIDPTAKKLGKHLDLWRIEDIEF